MSDKNNELLYMNILSKIKEIDGMFNTNNGLLYDVFYKIIEKNMKCINIYQIDSTSCISYFIENNHICIIDINDKYFGASKFVKFIDENGNLYNKSLFNKSNEVIQKDVKTAIKSEIKSEQKSVKVLDNNESYEGIVKTSKELYGECSIYLPKDGYYKVIGNNSYYSYDNLLNKNYEIHVQDCNIKKCSCPGFKNHNHCYHSKLSIVVDKNNNFDLLFFNKKANKLHILTFNDNISKEDNIIKLLKYMISIELLENKDGPEYLNKNEEVNLNKFINVNNKYLKKTVNNTYLNDYSCPNDYSLYTNFISYRKFIIELNKFLDF